MPFHHRVFTPLFPDRIPPKPPEPEVSLVDLARPSMKEIKAVVCAYYQFTPQAIDGPSRDARLVRARQMFCFLSRKFNGSSLPEIGRRCGGRDHTTALHACKRVEERLASSQDAADELEHLRMRLAAKVSLRLERINGNGSDEASN